MASPSQPLWLSKEAVEALQLDLIRVHGGMPGLRDDAGLESALARPRNRFAYHPEADAAELAAAYGFGLARNHPFHDGNKRIAFVAIAVFAGLNGYRFEALEEEVVAVMRALAAGEVTEKALAKWVRAHLVGSEGE